VSAPGAAIRIVAHLDMDAFYAAVEEQRNPALRGRPIVVGADPKAGAGRGVVTAASYTARKYGIRSAMPISRAWRLAEAARRHGEPEAVFVRGDHAVYREVSVRIMALAARGADAFEEASIDEAFLDLSSLGAFERAVAHARAVKTALLEREGLTCSIGIGPNKLVAKIASDFEKPDGLTVVRPEAVQAFLDPLPIRRIPGIGPKSEAVLQAQGIRTIADLRALEPTRLAAWFGKGGLEMAERARGISDSPVTSAWERKSVGEQETFERDTLEPVLILARAQALAAGVFTRLRAEGFESFRTVTVTVRFENFVTLTRSRTAGDPIDTQDGLEALARDLLLPFFDERENPRRRKIRLIGVRAEKLLREAPASQRALLAVERRPSDAGPDVDPGSPASAGAAPAEAPAATAEPSAAASGPASEAASEAAASEEGAAPAGASAGPPVAPGAAIEEE
jgi:DNA polymerase IV (DinB-like DNA polymerase)